MKSDFSASFHPIVSIVIPAFNSEGYISTTIAFTNFYKIPLYEILFDYSSDVN